MSSSSPHLSWTARARRQRFISSLDSSDLAYALLSREISESRMDMRAPPASPSPLSTAPAPAAAAAEEKGVEAPPDLVFGVAPPFLLLPRSERDEPRRFPKVSRRLFFRGGRDPAAAGESADDDGGGGSWELPSALLRLL